MSSTYKKSYSRLSSKQRRTVLEEAERNDQDVIYDCGGTIIVSGDYIDGERMRRNLWFYYAIYADC